MVKSGEFSPSEHVSLELGIPLWEAYAQEICMNARAERFMYKDVCPHIIYHSKRLETTCFYKDEGMVK